MNNKLNEAYEQQRRRQVSKMRAVLDYAMGMMIVFIGLFLILRFKLDLPLNKKFPPDIWDLAYGGLAILYGAWRIYRGHKKNYPK